MSGARMRVGARARKDAEMPASPRVEHELLTPQEAAALLRVPVGWVYARTRLGQMPGMVRIGKYVRINRQDLVAWVESQTNGTRP